MYSLFAKKESAHEDSIWTCVWGRRPERTVEEVLPQSEDQMEGDAEGEEDQSRSEADGEQDKV